MSEGQLFNDPLFHSLKADKPIGYALMDGHAGLARIVFYLKGNVAISGYQAPFGSIEIDNHSAQELMSFISEFVEDLRLKGVNQILILSPPGFYNNTAEVERCLIDFGFEVSVTEVNQHIYVDHQQYAQKISQKERNKLHRAIKEGYHVKQLDDQQISQAFELISATYRVRNFPVTMSEEQFRQASCKIKGRYFLFGLYDKKELIAVVASVLVSKNVLYNFYHADHADYRKRSPMVKLLGETYQFCLDNGISILDLGISTAGGELNNGLFRFKKNLGCEVSPKKTFQLKLAK